MTNKSLSEQICEVCGIKPTIIEDYDSNEYEIYPDFENNNDNFIKLMELDFDSLKDEERRNPSLWCFLNCLDCSPINKEGYLGILLWFLKDNGNGWRENLQRDVKQAIKQEQWEV